MALTIVAKVERVRFPKGDWPLGRTFAILATDKGVLKGYVAFQPKEGMMVEARDADFPSPKYGWTVSKYNGAKEFSFYTAAPYVPTDERATLHYAATMTIGMGDKMEEDIWEALGDAWREAEPGCVRGFTERVYESFKSAVADIGESADRASAISFIISKGGSVRMAEAAWEKWGRDTISTVSSDCFSLAKLRGFSFADIDERIRPAFGITDRDPRRVSAAVSYFMSQLTNGPTVADWTALRDAVRNATGLDARIVSDSVKASMADGEIIAFPKTQRLALFAHAYAEEGIRHFVEDSL